MNKKGFQSNANHSFADSLHFIVNKFGEGRARTTYKEGVGPCTRKGQGPVEDALNRQTDMTENIIFLQFC